MSSKEQTYVLILGTAQDAGVPHAGCRQACCSRFGKAANGGRHPTSLAIVEPSTKNYWLVDCTPRIPEQLRMLDTSAGQLQGVFLTHAHIGHYTGLMYFGREAMNTDGIAVYTMSRMASFLRMNAPWSQLIQLDNIRLCPLSDDKAVSLSPSTSISPFLVPHRAEFSETVGFRIDGPRRSMLYLPDIDNWNGLSPSLATMIDRSDIALIDGTFYSANELRSRPMAEIPHPPIADTMQRLSGITEGECGKVHFIHLNHTNPVLDQSSPEFESVVRRGFNVARDGEQFAI